MSRNKHRKMFKAIQLMKILRCYFFVCSNCYSDKKSLNKNRIADYDLGFYYYLIVYWLLSLVLYQYLKMLRRV